MSNTTDLQAFDNWIGVLLSKLSPAARRQMLKGIGRDLRKRQQDRIAAQRNPDGSPYEPRRARTRLRDKAGRVKRRAMFQKLRTARFVKIDADANGITIGFDDRISKIARVHQDGQRAPVAPGGPIVQYPARVLLGFSEEDHALVLDHLLRHLTR